MERLTSHVQPYAWGSHTVLAELLGLPATGAPMAELWVGGHPLLPSTLADGRGLDAYVASAPERLLGDSRATGGTTGGGEHDRPRLPFLLKVLAVDAPLSLQTHPTRAQARDGFAREEAAGVARDAATRNYRDDNHKPELVLALTPFRLLYGFAPPSRVRARFVRLASAAGSAGDAFAPEQLVERALASAGPDADAPAQLAALVRALLRLDRAQAAALVDELRRAVDELRSAARAGGAGDGRRGECDAADAALLATVADLAGRHPDDPGVLVAACMNLVLLEPGSALFVEAGVLHAHLHGVCIEAMAASDNVLRGGLTPKHVDVDELLSVLRTEPSMPAPSTLADAPRCADFRLHRLGPRAITPAGPAVVLCVDGMVTARSDTAGAAELARGDTLFYGADETVSLTASGTAFVCNAGTH